MRRIFSGVIVGSLVVSLGSCADAELEAVDLLLHNGKVVTVDEAFSIQQALAVRDGIIIEVGREGGVRALGGVGAWLETEYRSPARPCGTRATR